MKKTTVQALETTQDRVLYKISKSNPKYSKSDPRKEIEDDTHTKEIDNDDTPIHTDLSDHELS